MKRCRRNRIKKNLAEVLIFCVLLCANTNYVYAAGTTQSHVYYKGVPADGAALADLVAQNIAASVMSNPAYTTDLQRVNAAAAAVSSYQARGVYGADENKYYRSPYGLFVAGVYTCAGTARAMGRVLDYMGIPYVHVNENQWAHQWCTLYMDGQIGFADGMAGIAGYGEYHSGYTTSNGRTIVFKE